MRAEPYLAAALITTCFMGIFPMNLALALGGALLIWKAAGHRVDLAAARPWLIGLGIYLVARIAATAASPDPAANLRHLAKDWRLLALMWGASGALAAFRRPHHAIVLGGMGFCLAFGLLDLSGHNPFPLANAERYHFNRTGSFLGLPLTLGGAAMLALFLPGTVPGLGRGRRLGHLLLALALLGISNARGAWLGAAAGGGLWTVLARRGRRVFVAALVAAAVVAVVTPEVRNRLVAIPANLENPKAGAGHRLKLWRASAAIAGERALGVGPGRFQPEIRERVRWEYGSRIKSTAHAHNVFFHALAEGGFPGLIGVLALYGGIGLALFRRGARENAAGLGALVAMTAAGMTEVNFYDGEVAVLFFMLMGHALWRAGAGIDLQPKGAA